MAVAVLRPRSCIPGYYQEDVPQYVDTDVKLGEQTLTPGFKQHLDAFYDKANLEDKVKCLQLLTSLDISSVAKKHAPPATPLYAPRPPPCEQPRRKPRPHTAMAAMVSTERENLPVDRYGPYTTTYDREFWGNLGPSGQADRPASTRGFHASYPLNGPIGKTKYSQEYCKKRVNMAEPTRAGSSSGNRRNNPHPSEGFMNWRTPPRRHPEQPYSAWAKELTNEVMDRVCRGKGRSTYQSDYLGIPQGVKPGQTVKPEIEGPLPEDWRACIPYTLDSITRHAYQKPQPNRELKGNNSRYGCNKHKSVPAYGTVPTVSTMQMNLKARTTYERDYMEGLRPAGTIDIRTLGSYHTGNAIAAHTGQDGHSMMVRGDSPIMTCHPEEHLPPIPGPRMHVGYSHAAYPV